MSNNVGSGNNNNNANNNSRSSLGNNKKDDDDDDAVMTTTTGNSSTNTKKLSNSQKEAMNRMNKIIQQFLIMKDSVPFRDPVNWKELELYDYPKIVKRPMDLSTIQIKIDNNKYINAADIAYDIKLIWKNCMLYNAEGSDFYILAKLYSKRFEDRYRRIRNEFDVGEEPVYEEVNNKDAEDDELDENSDHPQQHQQHNSDDNDDDEDDNDDDDEEDHTDTNYTTNNSRSSSRSSLKKKSTSSTTSSANTGGRRSRSRGGSDVAERMTTSSHTSSKDNDTDNDNNDTDSNDGDSDDQRSIGTNNKTNPKLDDRAKLANNLLLLNGIELGYVISKLEKNCPQSLEQGPKMSVPEQLEINLDIIDTDTFHSICNYANDKATQRKRSKQFQLLQQQLTASSTTNNNSITNPSSPTSSAPIITSSSSNVVGTTSSTTPKQQYHETTLDSLATVSKTELHDGSSPDGVNSTAGISTSAAKKKRKR